MSSALVLYSEITGRYLLKVKDGRTVTTAQPQDARTYDSWRYAETALSLLPDKHSAGWQIMGRDAAMMKGGQQVTTEQALQYLGQAFFLLAFAGMLWMGIYSDVKGGDQ